MLASVPDGEVRALSRIAESQQLPASFLAKIFQKLARQGLLSAARGPGSGYALARPATSITIREILEIVEGKERRRSSQTAVRDRSVGAKRSLKASETASPGTSGES